MAEDDLNLTIQVNKVADFLSCPICICDLSSTFMTICGHRFCEGCIKESVDRHHKCPCCNAPLQQKDLIKDHQFDTLIGTVNNEKDKSEKIYFEKLISEAAEPSASSSQEVKDVFSPVENVLKKHLKDSLITHEKYYKDLTRQYDLRLKQSKAQFQKLINDLQRQDLMEEELESQRSDLENTHKQQLENLQTELDSCVKMVADAFDKYLEDHVPSLSVLPVKVSVNILSRNIQIPDIILKPHDSVEELKRIVEENMEKRGDRIVRYDTDCKFICFGPFTKRSIYEMNQMAYDLVNQAASNTDIFILPEQSRPVLQFAMKPGSEIALFGTIQLESELPKPCFAATFRQGAGHTVDYFSCKTCSINWVCRPCMERCHKVHHVAPYIMNHQPTWACCYCPKKKKCINQPT